ncbi:uncharacterized protein LOC133654390 [Entelurus aequoreus]|uniref:uncharacterized protein LOC133654390 n=1 Tax=Entelurus aequoreus TaxID=161455 RepID=UPI002B1D4761|nr:uncharacterized protein LOC133654390 [Entelurus aequoreus]
MMKRKVGGRGATQEEHLACRQKKWRNTIWQRILHLPFRMLLHSSSERRPLLGFTALLTKSFTTTPPSFTPKKSIWTLQSLNSPPVWVTQALFTIDQGERELQNLMEQQQAGVDEMNQELDSSVINAEKEERRLLEKVERHHRKAQQLLSQVRRENTAAMRVVQSLVDQQLQKMARLKEQLKRWGSSAGGAEKLHQLQEGVEEVTKPWEICLTLKRVSYKPNSQSQILSLGEVEVHEQGMTYPIGVCGGQGQKCALHSGKPTFSNTNPLEIRTEPQVQRQSPEENTKTKCGNMPMVRKLHLSSCTEDEVECASPRSPLLRLCGETESCKEEEAESVCSETPREELFPAFPALSSQGESEDDGLDDKLCITKKRFKLKGKKKQKAHVLVSCEEHYFPQDKSDTRNDARSDDLLCQLGPGSLSTRRGSLSQQAPSLQNISNESSKDSESPVSPANSDDSCYIYPADDDRSLKQKCSLSSAKFSGKLCSISPANKSDCGAIRKVNRMRLASKHSSLEQSHRLSTEPEPDRKATRAGEQHSRSQTFVSHHFSLNCVSKSLSMAAIVGEDSQRYKNEKKEKDAASFRELVEERGSTLLDSAYLVKQFGKQGSGRTDFNLPSGLHATVNGQLFVVDCGNARIQVTDTQKNFVQQVSPSGTERSSRICNYFDVAVNSKGLIALTCAAERAVLVFSRHGRLLQTFGGIMSGTNNEELDAPRGVTLIRQDEFLVADIKRGTLTALKLDPKTGARLERTVVTGYHRPYMVAACLATGLMAVSERGNETGRVACIRVLEPGWTTIRILGVCSGLGPVLSCPWGLCIDSDGNVLVADWGKQNHRVLLYTSTGVGWPVVTEHLNNPRGLALLPDGHMVISDSMNHSIKIYRYKLN